MDVFIYGFLCGTCAGFLIGAFFVCWFVGGDALPEASAND